MARARQQLDYNVKYAIYIHVQSYTHSVAGTVDSVLIEDVPLYICKSLDRRARVHVSHQVEYFSQNAVAIYREHNN